MFIYVLNPQRVTVTASELWIICATSWADSVNVELKLTAENATNANQDLGIIRIVNDAYAMDTRTRVTHTREYVWTVRDLQKDLIVTGV